MAATSLWAHAQTVTAALPFSRGAPAGVRHEVVELPIDEGGVLVAACTLHGGERARPAVVVLHGVSGSSEDHYVVRAARSLARAGFHVARMNQRGSGIGMGKSRRLGHAGFGEDLAIVVRHLNARSDVSSIGALGFSLGGHVALSLAADLGAGVAARDGLDKLKAIVSVSAPLDLDESTRAFTALRDGRFTGVYERMIVKSLLERAHALKHANPASAFSLDELARVQSIFDFDAVVTCRAHGFVDVADYHTRASVGPKLRHIALPTLAIHADDDPMVPVNALRRYRDDTDASVRSAAIDVDVVPTGGHVGFIESFAQLWGASAAVTRALAHFQRHLT